MFEKRPALQLDSTVNFPRVKTEAPSEDGTEVWSGTEEFPNMALLTDSGKEHR